MADAHKNFAYSTVATAPSPATSGTSLVVQSGDGAKFPAVPFNATLWPNLAQPTVANAEIVRVTAIATDTLTIVRAQESSSARSSVIGDQIAATVTSKTLQDLENSFLSAFNVKGPAYGAKGDDTTDDTAAVQACINACYAAGGGTVYFPAGQYILTPPSVTVPAITIPSTIKLVGAGRGSLYTANTKQGTSLVKNANGILLDFSGVGPLSETTLWNYHQGVESMTIQGGSNTGPLYRTWYCQYFTEKDVYLGGNADTQVDMVQFYDGRFYNGTYQDSGSTSAHTPAHLIRNSAAPQTTLSSGISGTVTALPVAALSAAMPAGIVQVWNGAGQFQNFTTTGAILGATSIPVTSVAVAHTFITGNVTNGFGWSGDNTNATVFEGCHWESNMSGAIWITQGPSNTNAANNIRFIGCKVEEDTIGFNAPIIQVDVSADAIFFDGLYLYAGGFNTGYTTNITAIQFHPTWGSISNSYFGMGTNIVLTSMLDINTTYGSPLSNTNMFFGAQPSVSAINFSGTSIINLFCVSIVGASVPYSGTGPFNFQYDINGTSQMVSDFYNYGVTHTYGGTDSSNIAAYTTPTFVTATAKQLDTAHDVMLYISVKTAISVTLAIGATSTPTSSIVPVTTLPVGSFVSVRIPCGWWVKVTCATMADLQFSQVIC